MSSTRKNEIAIDGNNSDIDKAAEQSVVEACIAGDLDFVVGHLAAGHDVNANFSSGWTLLLYAASYCHPHIIQYLLSNGAEPNKHHEGYSPLMALCYSNKGSPENRMQCLNYLLDNGAEVNAANKLKETPLMYACREQELDFVVKLLEHNAFINFADSEERTALFYAVISNKLDIIEILIEKGADINLQNYSGLNACDVAIMRGYDHLVPLLNVNCENEIDYVDVLSVVRWKDMFSNMSKLKNDELDNDVEDILYGMGLERYKNCFCGIDLSTFLKLKEEDVEKLGVDISVHRKKFSDQLLKFHKFEWNNNLMKIDTSQTFNAFEAIKVLGNINKQLSVMSSSIYFSKNYLDSIQKNENLNLSREDKEKIKEEIENMKIATLKIKAAIQKINNIVKYIYKQNTYLTLPIYIDKKNRQNKHKWIVISLISLASIYFMQMKTVKKLWNPENVFSKHLRNSLLPTFLFDRLNKFNYSIKKSLNFI